MFDEHFPLMEGAGDAGGGGGAVATVDAGAGSGELAGGESGGGEVHNAEFVDEGTGSTSQADRGSSDSKAMVRGGDRAIESGRITQSGRAAIEAARSVSPKIAQQLAQGLLIADWFRQQFPNGKRDVESIRKVMEQYGGEKAVQDMHDELTRWDQVDRWYSTGDPQFLQFITGTPELDEAFVRIMPNVMERFRQIAPDQFAHSNAKEFARALDDLQARVVLLRAADVLNTVTSLIESRNVDLLPAWQSQSVKAFNELSGMIEGIYALAKKAPEVRQRDTSVDQRTQAAEQRERDLDRREYDDSVAAQRKRLFASEYAKLSKGRTITPDQDAEIKGYYEMRMMQRVRNFDDQSERYLAARDKDGYVRHKMTFANEAIPDSLRRAFEKVMTAKPGPKAPAARSAVSSRGQARPQGGTQRVQRMPGRDEVDYFKTTADMLHNNEAVLKDGRRVKWA